MLTPSGGYHVQPFKDLKVWQRSHSLVMRVYNATASLPADERFGITSQVRRAAVSVPTNIAEGSRRLGRTDYARFLNIAEGSLAETEYLLILCRDLEYLTSAVVEPMLGEIDEIARMLNVLRSRVDPRVAK